MVNTVKDFLLSESFIGLQYLQKTLCFGDVEVICISLFPDNNLKMSL